MIVVNGKSGSKDLLTRKFSSYKEMVDYAKKPLSVEVINKYGRGVEESANEHFNGANYQDGMRNATLGWKEGWEIAEKLSTDFRITLGDTTLRKKTETSYHGQSVNMSRYLMGDPRNMRYSKRKKLKKKGRIVKIFVHSGMLANVSTSQIMNRGAAILALVESLEATGYRVELEGGFLANGDYGCVSDYRFPIKAAEQPIDKDRLGFVLVSPSMHRILGFRIREHESMEWHKKFRTFQGQGATIDYTKASNLEPTNSDVYMGVNGNDWEVFNSTESSTRWLKEQFEVFGIETEAK